MSNEVHPIQQTESDAWGIFSILNAFFISCGIIKPNLISDQDNSKNYRNSLGLCLLESNASFLLS